MTALFDWVNLSRSKKGILKFYFMPNINLLLLALMALVTICLMGACRRNDNDITPRNPDSSTPNDSNVTTLISTLDVPWEVLWGPDDFLWVTERYGRISRIHPQTGEQQVLATVEDTYQNGESGLLGMALHPDFQNSPFVYVVHTYLAGAGPRERLVRYRYNGTALEERTILLDNITANRNHNGSRLLITNDGYLLMSTGDAGYASLAQDMNSLSGKFLRLNLDGTIPADNPIPGSYLYSWGHRNPQGLLQLPNGTIFSSEHGPNTDDEINIIRPGQNYGWPTVAGLCDNPSETSFCNANNVIQPLAIWTPTIAPSDIAYYNHSAIPAFRNNILMTTLNGERLIALSLNESGTSITGQRVFFQSTYGRLRDICVAPDGRVFIATNGNGRTGNQFNHSIIVVNQVEQ